MMKRRLATAMILATFAGACSELAVPTEIEEPQMAKGGGKGKPGGGGTPVLEEFWVTPGESSQDPDIIHVVWSGGGTSVNPSVIQDYFFDGIRQDDPPVGAHYEYLSWGPPKSPGAQIADGMMHVDIHWNGSRLEDGGAPYPNYVTTEVTGEGDPFAFTLAVFDGDTRLATFVPFGVVVGGVNTFGVVEPEAYVEVGLVHEAGTQRSYATFSGDTPEGWMWVENLSIESGTLTCTVVTVTSGRGKNKTRTEETVVSATIVVDFGRSPPITLTNGEYTWWEGHFLDPSTGALSRRVSAPNESGIFSVSGVMPEGWSGDSVEFIVDYLVSSSSPNGSENEVTFSNYVYDPSSNPVDLRTTAGLLGDSWSNDSPSASPGDGRFPVAHSQLVTCPTS